MYKTDKQKAEQLYELYEKKMYKMAYSFLRDKELAEDAVHEAFVKIIRQLDKVKDAESDRTKHWIMKVMKHTAIDLYRRQRREMGKSVAMPLDTVEDEKNVIYLSQKNMENKEQAEYILAMLPDTDVELLKLKYYYQLSDDEVAERMALSVAAVRKRIQRLKKRIVERIGEERDEESRKLFG